MVPVPVPATGAATPACENCSVTATTALLVVIVVWLLIGVVASVVMGRRGHRPFTWGILGAALGPLVVVLAQHDVRREREAEPIPLSTGDDAADGIAVLIGVDGSPEAHAALVSAVDVLAPRLGRVALAYVVDFETPTDRPSPARSRAEELLAREARHVRERTGREPAQVLLQGPPAAALRGCAIGTGSELLVIGARGRGASKHLLGSVASEIARDTPVPVFVVTPATTTGDTRRA